MKNLSESLVSQQSQVVKRAGLIGLARCAGSALQCESHVVGLAMALTASCHIMSSLSAIYGRREAALFTVGDIPIYMCPS